MVIHTSATIPVPREYNWKHGIVDIQSKCNLVQSLPLAIEALSIALTEEGNDSQNISTAKIHLS